MNFNSFGILLRRRLSKKKSKNFHNINTQTTDRYYIKSSCKKKGTGLWCLSFSSRFYRDGDDNGQRAIKAIAPNVCVYVYINTFFSLLYHHHHQILCIQRCNIPLSKNLFCIIITTIIIVIMIIIYIIRLSCFYSSPSCRLKKLTQSLNSQQITYKTARAKVTCKWNLPLKRERQKKNNWSKQA